MIEGENREESISYATTQVSRLISEPTAKTIGTFSRGILCDFRDKLFFLKAREEIEKKIFLQLGAKNKQWHLMAYGAPAHRILWRDIGIFINIPCARAVLFMIKWVPERVYQIWVSEQENKQVSYVTWRLELPDWCETRSTMTWVRSALWAVVNFSQWILDYYSYVINIYTKAWENSK